jgi:hypothetical protein
MFLEDIRALCLTYGVQMLAPIIEDAGVGVFSMRGHLWSGLAELVIELAKANHDARRAEVVSAD